MFSKPKPSEYIRRHLAGQGFALDDLVSRHEGDPKYADAISEAMTIWSSGTDEGSKFEALAKKLEAEGR